MIVCGVDLETTGTDPETAEIVEIGLVLWDTDNNKIIQCDSKLVYVDEIPEEAQAIHGITTEEVKKFGITHQAAMELFREYQVQSEYIIAHNGTKYDRIIVERYYDRRFGITLKANWIDSMTDIPFPEPIKVRRLPYLAADHGFINPFPHRALFDVMTMLKVMSQYPFEKIIEISKQPTVRVVAQIGYPDKDRAKDRSYRWDSETREWFKEMKLYLVERERAEAPFLIKILA